jgi:hypothetical protein
LDERHTSAAAESELHARGIHVTKNKALTDAWPHNSYCGFSMHASPDANTLIARLAEAIAPARARHRHRRHPPAACGWPSACMPASCAQPLGTLDISFYRDDFSRIGLHPQVNRPTCRSIWKTAHHSGRRRCAYQPHRARGNERTIRLRPPGIDPAGGTGRPRRPRIADRPDFTGLVDVPATRTSTCRASTTAI